jgi:hypothetical protein
MTMRKQGMLEVVGKEKLLKKVLALSQGSVL